MAYNALLINLSKEQIERKKIWFVSKSIKDIKKEKEKKEEEKAKQENT